MLNKSKTKCTKFSDTYYFWLKEEGITLTKDFRAFSTPLTGLTRLIPINLEFSEHHVSTQTHAQGSCCNEPSAQRCGIIYQAKGGGSPLYSYNPIGQCFILLKIIRMLAFLRKPHSV